MKVRLDGIRRWKVQSQSDARRWYTIIKRAGKFACGCPHFIFRRKVCKHIHAVQEYVG